MNKLEDKIIVQVWQRGYDDFLSHKQDGCPYTRDSLESEYWIMGFEDAFDAQMKITDFSEEFE